MARKIPIERIRSVGILAHIDAGGTATSGRILFDTGVHHRVGEVDHGTATMDGMVLAIASAATNGDWRDRRIHLNDTPGHVDFTTDLERSLRALDGAEAVFCAVDRVGASFDRVGDRSGDGSGRVPLAGRALRRGSETDSRGSDRPGQRHGSPLNRPQDE